jgi:hypothetical protein
MDRSNLAQDRGLRSREAGSHVREPNRGACSRAHQGDLGSARKAHDPDIVDVDQGGLGDRLIKIPQSGPPLGSGRSTADIEQTAQP